MKKSDLDFEVTTTPADVKRFLETEFAGVKVVFSTYMSASVVGEAVKGRDIFDLGIFDEAHKTTGREGKTSAFALSDNNLPLKKRVFMTATPRHYNVLKRDKEGDAKLVYSMDVPESYGSVVHKLPFAKAARAGIICRYKVVISVVTSEMVRQEFLRRGKVLVAGDEIHAQQVANQLALAAAVEKHGVGKIITFHKNIKSAQSFTAEGSEGIANHLKGFSVFHVNGSMPSAEREKLMGEFKNSNHGLVSNAKCLTEGVDVPAVDMVAFLSPKRSTVDIVQATGRAMRKAPKKEFGYILVPLYLEIKKSETIEEAVRRGKFEEVWDVLAALQEQDEVLADIIREMRQEKGRTKGYRPDLPDPIEILGPNILLEDLKKSITVSCLEKLGDTWDERFGELGAFKNRLGHCNVPSIYPENPRLGIWVANQRHRRGNLSKENLRRLDEIGFDWSPFSSAWEEGFRLLQEYKCKHGDCRVRISKNENSVLARWVRKQRSLRGKPPKEYIRRLKEIGFEWDPFTAAWENEFESLKKYKTKYGNCRVPFEWPKNSKLASWVSTQRKIMGKLSKEQINRLNEIGFEWDPLSSVWEENFKLLKNYKAQHGNCNVPARWSENPKLGAWVSTQRIFYKQGKMSQEHMPRLKAIGFVWDAKASQ